MNLETVLALFETAEIVKYIAYFSAFNFVLIFVEMFFDLSTSKERRWKDTGANFIILFAEIFLERTIFGTLILLILAPIHAFAIMHIPINIWSWHMALILTDFTYYWMHRIKHEYRILWAVHSVHHSSEDYNLSVAIRSSIIDGLVSWIFFVPIILLGFGPFQTLVCLTIVLEYQTWIHTKHINKMGWLDEVFNTPSIHRVHHGSNKKYLDKNYGGILIIWDKRFGTYQREKERVVFGLTKDIKTNNPIKISFIEFKNIWDDVKRCRNWKDRFRIIFGGLVWRPAYFEENKTESK